MQMNVAFSRWWKKSMHIPIQNVFTLIRQLNQLVEMFAMHYLSKVKVMQTKIMNFMAYIEAEYTYTAEQ